jgi:hypothetical protein
VHCSFELLLTRLLPRSIMGSSNDFAKRAIRNPLPLVLLKKNWLAI